MHQHTCTDVSYWPKPGITGQQKCQSLWSTWIQFDSVLFRDKTSVKCQQEHADRSEQVVRCWNVIDINQICVPIEFFVVTCQVHHYNSKFILSHLITNEIVNNVWGCYHLLQPGWNRLRYPILVAERLTRSRSQCTGSQPEGDFLSHLPGGRLPLLSARPAVTFPAEERHSPSTSTKLYCLVTEAHRCEQLAKGCYAALSQWELNPPPIDRKCNALTLRYCATWLEFINILSFTELWIHVEIKQCHGHRVRAGSRWLRDKSVIFTGTRSKKMGRISSLTFVIRELSPHFSVGMCGILHYITKAKCYTVHMLNTFMYKLQHHW